MFSFTVNGKQVSTGETKKLIDFLRDDLRLTSVKNGCMEGACGACTVVVDGKAQRACIPTTAKMEGKSVVTVEGLSQRERQVYAYAFTEAGAVQCGFCIPGMVMSAKALLDSNPAPDRAAVKAALRGNICRCTGYKKIIDAILLAADLLRSGAPVPERACAGLVGDPLGRLDAPAKVLGTAEYADDMALPGMLFGGAVRSAYPRARVLSIDCSAALALEGVVAAVTAEDIPGAQYIGHLVQDWPVLVAQGEITRTVGDAIVLLAAESKAILAQAKQLVQIEYEVLPPVTCPAEALAEGAPLLHKNGNLLKEEHLVRGDAAAAIAASPYVVTAHYSTPFTEHAFLEPETSVSAPDGAGGVIIWSGDQGVYQTQKECSAMLGLPAERVRVIGKAIGGGFGGKEDMSVQHHASLLAYLTGRPVKVSLSRQESIAVHPKRHAMEMDFTTACDENGILTAMTAVIIADTGAYASLGGPVLQRACTHAAGPYHYENIDILGRAVYTNNPPAGAFRGFGVTQSCFAMERNLDLLAKKVGISPFEIRLRNAIRPGQVLPNGQIADDSTALVETLEAVRDVYHSAKYAGIACAMKNSGLGVGIPDTGRCPPGRPGRALSIPEPAPPVSARGWPLSSPRLSAARQASPRPRWSMSRRIPPLRQTAATPRPPARLCSAARRRGGPPSCSGRRWRANPWQSWRAGSFTANILARRTPWAAPRKTRSATLPIATLPMWSPWQRTAKSTGYTPPTTLATPSIPRTWRGRLKAAWS